jgi:phosphoenolpyruvate carboxykinase (ATP)
MAPTKVRLPRRFPGAALPNPPPEELRALARPEERTTDYGAPSYVTRFRSRSAHFTKNTLDDPITDADWKALEDVVESFPRREWIQLDRWIGEDPRFRVHARLYVPREYARIAFGWGQLLIPAPADHEPDIVTVDVPDWPERRILVDPIERVNYVLGTDYIGEAKMSFLRLWMYLWKERGGLGFHAGSKVVRVRDNPRWMLFFGLSGTGKTTLTNHTLGLPSGKTFLVQDDIVAWLPDGLCLGSENKGLYVKTEGLTPESQPAIYQAATRPSAILENVWVGPDGRVDFGNYELTTNGRAVVLLEELPNAAPSIDAPRVDQIFFITRNPLAPALARLDHAQAAVAFMLGESVETSAGDPTRAGQAVRVVGTNPFIVGPPQDEGNAFLAMLERSSHVECYLVNTGTLGEGERSRKIRLEETVALLRAVAEGSVAWVYDRDLRLEVPASAPGVPVEALHPRAYYGADEFRAQLERLRTDRRAWLGRFPGLRREIREALY